MREWNEGGYIDLLTSFAMLKSTGRIERTSSCIRESDYDKKIEGLALNWQRWERITEIALARCGSKNSVRDE